MSRQRPAGPPRVQGDRGGVQTTTNLTPSCRGSSQILVSCFTMMPGLRLRSSVLHFVTQPLFWSESQQVHIWEAVPLKGSMKGSKMKRLHRGRPGPVPWGHWKPNFPPLLLINVPRSLSQSNPCLSLSSLKPHPVGALFSQHEPSGEDAEMQSAFLDRRALVGDLKGRTESGLGICARMGEGAAKHQTISLETVFFYLLSQCRPAAHRPSFRWVDQPLHLLQHQQHPAARCL